jgi:16S rRNA (guanine527-N7)-methyltransferase
MELVDSLRRQLQTLDIELDDKTLQLEVDFLNEMLRWNKTYNLTSVTDPEAALEKHLLDSLTLLPYLGTAESILDIGSGGGFPGIPLQIARPDLRVTSVDAVAKKITFQRHVARRLKLARFTPWHGRIENLPQQEFALDGFDLVVARAFASLGDLLKLALPCLKPGGCIVAMKGPEGAGELVGVSKWLVENGLHCRQQITLSLPQSGASRNLLFFSVKPQDVA